MKTKRSLCISHIAVTYELWWITSQMRDCVIDILVLYDYNTETKGSTEAWDLPVELSVHHFVSSGCFALHKVPQQIYQKECDHKQKQMSCCWFRSNLRETLTCVFLSVHACIAAALPSRTRPACQGYKFTSNRRLCWRGMSFYCLYTFFSFSMCTNYVCVRFHIKKCGDDFVRVCLCMHVRKFLLKCVCGFLVWELMLGGCSEELHQYSAVAS